MSIEKLTAVADELAAAKAKVEEFAKTEGRTAIGAAFAKCFEPPTNLVRIEWTQYTPHFNDGDACAFSVHEPTLVAEVDGEECEHEDYCIPGDEEADLRDSQNKAVADLGRVTIAAYNAVWPIDESILEAVFGDGVKVTITKDEVTVEEYDHD